MSARNIPRRSRLPRERVLKLHLSMAIDDRVALYDDQIIAGLADALQYADEHGVLFPGVPHPRPGERLRGVEVDIVGVARRPLSGPLFRDISDPVGIETAVEADDSEQTDLSAELMALFEELGTRTNAMRAMMARIQSFEDEVQAGSGAKPNLHDQLELGRVLLRDARAMLGSVADPRQEGD